MYVKIENNCIVEASSTEKEGYEYISLNYEAFIRNKAEERYKITPFGVLLKNGLPVYINKNKEKKVKKETSVVDRREERLKAIKEQFEKAIDMNVKYKNGFYYKPRYASESYQPLISAEVAIRLSSNNTQTLFPKEIWDATKTHSSIMTFDELKDLALYLANIYERQFQKYKRQCANILL